MKFIKNVFEGCIYLTYVGSDELRQTELIQTKLSTWDMYGLRI